MRSLNRRRTQRLLLPVVALAAALVAGSLGSTRAWAGLIACDTDPIVPLSNSASVTMWASIATAPSNVTQVNYVLHVPPGVNVVAIAYDSYAYLEHVQVVHDMPAHHYRVQATLSTSVDSVPVTVGANVTARTSSTGGSGERRSGGDQGGDRRSGGDQHHGRNGDQHPGRDGDGNQNIGSGTLVVSQSSTNGASGTSLVVDLDGS